MRKQNKLALKLAITGMVAVLVLTGCQGLLEEWLERNSDVTLSLTWEGGEDLDLYLTYPAPADNDTTDDAGTPTYGSIADAYYPALINGDEGFYPEDGTANRAFVNQVDRSSADGDVRWFSFGDDSDDNDNREVIYIDQLPFNYTLGGGDYNTTPNSANALPSGYDYAWVGVLEGYVWGFDGDVSDAEEVKLTVYNEDDRLLGEFVIPQEMTVKGTSLVRIPVFQVEGRSAVVYQVLAHTQLLTASNQIRSVGETTTVGDYTVLATFFAEVE